MTNPLLQDSISTLRGVGPKLRQRLEELGINTLEALLFHFPLRYQDRTQLTPIGALQDGAEAVVSGRVRAASVLPGRRRALVVKLDDGTGLLTLRFFHFRHSQQQQMKAGAELSAFGQVRRGGGGAEIIHPEYRLGDAQQLLDAALTPIYPTVEGIGQSIWRNLTDQALTVLSQRPPKDLLKGISNEAYSIADAISYLHRPPAGATLAAIRAWRHPAQLRLAKEELLAHQLSMRDLRAQERAFSAPKISGADDLRRQLLSALPFEPTAAQRRVLDEIAADLAKATPMLRLVQGDVGSGKTLVAALATLSAMGAGYQVALMAPTELLAEQHLRNFQDWFEPLGLEVAWLSGKVKAKARRDTLEAIANGKARLIVGTHALFQEQVNFHNLALVIIDEQHRFGVHQRLALTQKGEQSRMPHQLVLTATPIPRTLSMLAYADLDCSVIDELPPGRKPITTSLLDNQRRAALIARVGKACREGKQAYWVCTIIEESEVLDARPAETTATMLREQLPDVVIGLIHGRLSSSEKEQVMADFKAGQIGLLVATTVIEVGVDVPNASLMIIENPERLGLAQLHQLRGRVGRGGEASFCVLLYQAPLSQHAKARLNVMRESNDGFFIAEEDLRLRGPGELLGTRQTGLMTFRVAQLPEHEDLLDEVAGLAAVVEQHHPDNAEALMDRWTGERRAFARV